MPAAASIAITASGRLGRKPATTSPGPMPSERRPAATRATSARSSLQLISRRSPRSFRKMIAGSASGPRRRFSAKLSRARGNQRAPGIRSPCSRAGPSPRSPTTPEKFPERLPERRRFGYRPVVKRAVVGDGAPRSPQVHEAREIRVSDAKQRGRPDRLFGAHSQSLVVRSGTPFGRRPGDDSVRILDVACLAVDAIRRVDLQAPSRPRRRPPSRRRSRDRTSRRDCRIRQRIGSRRSRCPRRRDGPAGLRHGRFPRGRPRQAGPAATRSRVTQSRSTTGAVSRRCSARWFSR